MSQVRTTWMTLGLKPVYLVLNCWISSDGTCRRAANWSSLSRSRAAVAKLLFCSVSNCNKGTLRDYGKLHGNVAVYKRLGKTCKKKRDGWRMKFYAPTPNREKDDEEVAFSEKKMNWLSMQANEIYDSFTT